ncbi:MAG: respiratory nitrate reductase subunit gamma [Dehalococcoidia bacterium]|nr:respiratory nitrate reductase subunit gamma [Dehalococcoidia bacterium]
MDWFSFLAAGIMPYVSVVIFLGGTLYRIVRRRHTEPANQSSAGHLPQASSASGKQVFIIILLVAVLGLFLGHTRIFGDAGLVINLFGEDGLNRIGNVLGTGLGIFLLLALGYLLIRCLISSHKDTVFTLWPLLLVLLVVLLGNYLRLSKPFGLEDYRTYMASLVALHPTFPETIANSPARWALSCHVLSSSLLFIYLPFSPLIPTLCRTINKRLGRTGSPSDS